MTMEFFMFALLVVSVLTSLFTEAVKEVFEEFALKYSANLIAGICSVAVSILCSVGYIVFTGVAVTSQIVVCLIALIIMSWLCAMLGYDKVMQALTQLKRKE